MSNHKVRKIFDNLSLIAAASPKVAHHRHAAAVVLKKRVISYGVNSYKSSPFQARFAKKSWNIFQHAEVSAIKNSLRFLDVSELKYTTLYVCRIKHLTQSGPLVWGNSKPCEGCQKAISKCNKKNVWYTSDSDVIEQL